MKKISLDKSTLQLLAVIAMTADHCDFLVQNVWLKGLCNLLGRMTIIIMSFFVVEGYYKTKNIYKYIIRMGVFALISQIPFCLLHYGKIPMDIKQIYACFYVSRNVIFTLFIALILLVIIKSEEKIAVKALALLAALYITRNSDWRYWCIFWVLGFALYRGDKKKQILAASTVILLRFAKGFIPFIVAAVDGGISTVSLYLYFVQLGGFLALPLLWCYNGEKGKSYGLGFYTFYPLHMMILFIIGMLIK